MNVKSWSIGLAIVAAVVVYVIVSDPTSDSQDAQMAAAQTVATLPQAKPSTPADALIATPVAAVKAADEVAGRVNGRWAGTIDAGGGNTLQFSFNFQANNGQLTGTAMFPIGETSILGGRVDGNRLSFATHHQLKSSGQTLVSTFTGDMAASAIALTMLSEGAENKLTVQRVSH